MTKNVIICHGCEAKLRFQPPAKRRIQACPRCRTPLTLHPDQNDEAILDLTDAAEDDVAEDDVAEDDAHENDSVEDVNDYEDDSAESDESGEFSSPRLGRSTLVRAFLFSMVAGLAVALLWLKYRPEQEDNTSSAFNRSTKPKVLTVSSSTPSTEAGSSRTDSARSISGAASRTTAGEATSYHWRIGSKQTYKIEVRAGENGRSGIYSGECRYTVKAVGDDPREKRQATGTAFVVSADGILATCLHVVDGVKKIEVILGEKTYTADLIAQNPDQDLALLKISATALPVCKFSSSNQIQLAQTIRAFGYPLSSLLGNEIKVATGTVSGMADIKGEGRRIQTDAPINPGNSGGPLVDPSGAVIGIASSKLNTHIASSVGLAVPVAELKHLVEAAGQTWTPSTTTNDLGGPAVARQVIPAVALVRVSGSDAGRVFNVDYYSSVNQKGASSPGLQIMAAMQQNRRQTGRITVSEFGTVVSEPSSTDRLPYALGPVGQLVINPLDHHGRRTWSSANQQMIQIQTQRPGSPIDLFFGRPSGRNNSDSVKIVPAEETVSYTIVSEPGAEPLTIEKEYQFVTLEDEDAPLLKVSGSGTIVFDTKLGLPLEGSYKGTFQQTMLGKSTTLPITVSYRLVTKEDLRIAAQKASIAAAESKAKRDKERTVPDPETVTELLEEATRSLDASTIGKRLSRIAELAVVEELRPQIMEVVERYRKHKTTGVRSGAELVFVQYATEEHMPELKRLALISDRNLSKVSLAAARKVFKLGDTSVLNSFVKKVSKPFQRRQATWFLKSCGEAAEQAILEELPNIEPGTERSYVIEILADVGTTKSIPVLKEISKQGIASEAIKATVALSRIHSRQPK